MLQTLKVKNTGMAVTIDVGDPDKALKTFVLHIDATSLDGDGTDYSFKTVEATFDVEDDGTGRVLRKTCQGKPKVDVVAEFFNPQRKPVLSSGEVGPRRQNRWLELIHWNGHRRRVSPPRLEDVMIRKDVPLRIN